VAVALSVPVVATFDRPMRMLSLGDDIAGSLGVPVESVRRGLLLTAVALTAVATASAGPVPFVALAAPQLARRLTRSAEIGPLVSGLDGAALLAVADLGAQRLQLPVGVLTGALGGVYLAWLLAAQRRSRFRTSAWS
jgi:iron complex transport system permease protein